MCAWFLVGFSFCQVTKLGLALSTWGRDSALQPAVLNEVLKTGIAYEVQQVMGKRHHLEENTRGNASPFSELLSSCFNPCKPFNHS